MEISDDLLVDLNLNEMEQNYLNKIHDLAEEALEQENLPVSERSSSLLESERVKKEFFARQCGGIQFEYDAVARKVTSISCYNEEGKRTRLSNSATHLLGVEDWTALQEKLRRTTWEHPTVTMTALVPLNDEPRWQRVTAQSIWTEDSTNYVGIVGQFTDIHDEMVRRGKNLIVNGGRITGENFMRMIFMRSSERKIQRCCKRSTMRSISSTQPRATGKTP